MLNRKSLFFSNNFIQNFIYSIVYTVIASRYDKKVILNGSANNSGRFVIRQLLRMPRYLHLPFFILLIVFNYFLFFTTFKTFLSSNEFQRVRYLKSWKYSSLSFKRDFVKFFEALVIFEYSSNSKEK